MNTEHKGYWKLVALGEPFRLLFPLGVVIGIFGVMLWPLFVWGNAPFYPGVSHARIMIEGFLSCFVVGFLGTALPRLLDVPRLTLAEALGFASGFIGITILHHFGHTFWADQLFIVLLLTLMIGLAVRALFRKDTPPPGFILVPMGLLCALSGASLLVLLHVVPSGLPVWTAGLAKLLLYQGYLLLPIMGIGAFLLPRFFGLPCHQSFPESLTLPPGWKPKAVFAALCGTVVIISFAAEALGHVRVAYGLRAGAVLCYFFKELPFHQAKIRGSSLALGLRVALTSIPLGYVAIMVLPMRSLTLLHVVFITGFSLLTLIVATRVIFGHSGQNQFFRVKVRPVGWMVFLVVFAMLTRVAADWMPKVQMNHYGYAAVAWSLGVVIWAIRMLPSVRVADEE